MNEMLRFMLKPDKRTHVQTDTRMEGVYNLTTTTYAFHDLSLQSEAIAPIIWVKLDWANSAPTYPQTGHHSRHGF